MAAAISSTRSPSVRLAGRRLAPSLIASSFIVRPPLLAERGDALGEVRAGSHRVAELLLQRLAGQRVIGDRGADLPLDRLHRRGAVRSDQLRGLDRPTYQFAAGHKPVYQAKPCRLPSVDQ